MIPQPNDKARWLTIRRGLTLLELLVVLFILALLVGLMLAAIQKVRDAAARMACSNNLRQLAVAVHLYADDWHRLPRGCDYPFLRDPILLGLRDGVGMSWHTSILPYVEQNELWKQAWNAHRQDPSGKISLHTEVMSKTVPPYLCPSESRLTGGYGHNAITWGLTSYVGIAGTGVIQNDGIFHRYYTVRFADIYDGTSTTLMIGERPTGPKGIYAAWYAWWGASVCQLTQILPGTGNSWIPEGAIDCKTLEGGLRPGQYDNACDINHFWSLHSGGANFAFADGSVRFLAYSTSPVLPALATRAGGEIVPLPY